MQPTVRIARRCATLLLPRALPLGQTDGHGSILIRLRRYGLRPIGPDAAAVASRRLS